MTVVSVDDRLRPGGLDVGNVALYQLSYVHPMEHVRGADPRNNLGCNQAPTPVETTCIAPSPGIEPGSFPINSRARSP